jgi:transcriptional regulator with XRE-family HTH domain
VNEVGKRLKFARVAKGLSLRKFAKRFRENFTLLARIEKGTRFPPKERLQKFADALSLTLDQLQALIAVERRGLDPNQMLPEITPVPVKQVDIEAQAEAILDDFKCRQGKGCAFDGAISIEEIANMVDLHIEDVDLKKQGIVGPRRGELCGCFYPENFHGKARVVLINSGKINGYKLSPAERRVTIAHEVGHYFLHYGKKESKQLLFQFSKQPIYCREAEIDSGEFNLKEYQANIFGACLLMPGSQFKIEWVNVAGDETKLAKRFDVTEAFVCLRAKTLNL